MQVSQTITQRSASNLALAFILLPKEKQWGMSALYAFCREVDDIADEETRPIEERRVLLQAWREDVARACEGREADFPVNRELQPFIQKHRLPFSLFDELIKGVEMDLDIKCYPTYEALELYCYRVASVVGLLSIEIFGYTDPRCKEYAIALGQALQLTNILRDVGGDAVRGRIYLPQSALAEFGVRPEEILSHQYSDRFYRLAASVAARAKAYYQKARETLPAADRASMTTAELMGAVYWTLLKRLEERDYQVLDPAPVKLTKPHKAFLILRTWLLSRLGGAPNHYGVG